VTAPEHATRPRRELARSSSATARAGLRRGAHKSSSGAACALGAEGEQGRGLRLLQAFAAVERFPALADARAELLAALAGESPATGELAAIVEGDAALAIALLREANRGRKQRERVDAIAPAVERLGAAALREMAQALPTFDLLQGGGVWGELPARFRLHALATQRAAEAIAAELGHRNRGRLAVASLLHDVGKLAMTLLHPSHAGRLWTREGDASAGIRGERAELGLDHALVGGVLAQRWSFPQVITHAIERHHDAGRQGEAAIVGLADMLVHHQREGGARADELVGAAEGLGLGLDRLRRVMREQAIARRRGGDGAERCPLTDKELLVLKRLAQGLVYKQIAECLGVSASVVRTHLHNVYAKLGVRDRAQAVLLADRRGWL